MFTVDSITWPYPCDITRSTEMRQSSVSGMMLDGSYFSDVEGTFYNFTVKIAVPFTARQSYNSLRNVLTDPVAEHTFVLPDETGTLTVIGYIQNVNDVYVRMSDGTSYWKGIMFDIQASRPTRYLTLAQASAGTRAIFPDAAEHSEGDSWTWTNGRWELSASYPDADTTKY